MSTWTDERLNDLAATLEPLPAAVARIEAHLQDGLGGLRDEVRELHEDNRSLRGDVSAFQRQLTQVGWGLAAALVGVLVALVVLGT